MGVASEKTHGDIAMGGTLDLTRGEKSVGIAVDEEREHHVWRELPRACATVVDLKAFERQTMDGLTRSSSGTQSRMSAGSSIGVSRSTSTKQALMPRY
jgi:hypothetical protein